MSSNPLLYLENQEKTRSIILFAPSSAQSRSHKMKDSDRYAKVVEWSEEDQCYVGSCPGLMLGGCHGDDELSVFEELCEVVEEVVQLYREDGKALPPATAGRDLVNQLQNVA
jgi:predicted RNase H-like HicB family nuclease